MKAQTELDDLWDRHPATQRSTSIVHRCARVVLDLVVQARLEYGQLAAHIPRDPEPPRENWKGPQPTSLEKILRDRLEDAKVCGKTGHKAARLLARLGFLEIKFEDPLNDELVDKTRVRFGKRRRRRDGSLGSYYHVPMQLVPTNKLLEGLDEPDALLNASEYAPTLTSLALRAADRDRNKYVTSAAQTLAALGLDTGTNIPEQEYRQEQKPAPEVLRGGSDPPDFGPPETSEGRDLTGIKKWAGP